jgi:hypothetical protein
MGSDIFSEDRGVYLPSLSSKTKELQAATFLPHLGFGFDSKTGESSGPASLWFDFDEIIDRTRGRDKGGTQHSKLIQSISDVLEVTASSLNVSLKNGLFSGGGDFTNQCISTVQKRSLTYYITATKYQRFVISNFGQTFTDKIINQMEVIENHLYGQNPDLDKAKKAYKRLYDSIGPEYISEVVRRIYMGLRFKFTAISEAHMNEITIKLNAQYGGASANAAFNYLRTQSEKYLSYEVKIVGDGITDPVFQGVDYWNSPIKDIQDACLNGMGEALTENAPVVSFRSIPLWQALGYDAELEEGNFDSWLDIEDQRNYLLRELYQDFLFLIENENFLEVLRREQAIPLEIRDKMKAEMLNLRRKASKITSYALEVNSAENMEELLDIEDDRPNIPDSINFPNILPDERTNLVRINSFTGKVDAAAQTMHRRNWSGALKLGFKISSELKSLINTISLYRIPTNDVERLVYHGPFLDNWTQSEAILTIGYQTFGDDQPRAIREFTSQFKVSDKDTKYQLKLFWIDGKQEAIDLPRWTAL